MEPQVQYVQSRDGTSLAFWVMGDGPGVPLLMVSPLLFGHLTRELAVPEIRRWYDRMAEKRRVIRMDIRNQGLSQRGVAPWSREHAAADIEAVLDRVGLEQVNLLGFWGPAQAMVLFAARYPQRVARLLLWGATARNEYLDEPRFQTLISLAGRDWDMFAETFAHVYLGWSPGSTAHTWATFIRESVNPEDFVRVMNDMPREGVVDALPEVQAPTLIVHQGGVFSRTVDEEEPRLLASRIPNARLVHLDPPVRAVYENDAGAQAIESFLTEGDEVSDEPRGPSGTAIILFADIVDSTALTERLGDHAFREKARDLDTALRGIIRDNSGTPIEGKLLGDGVLATFTSARQAIEAAIGCGNAGFDAELPLHLGLHAGDVIREDGNVFGGAVNIAARISGEAAPGEVLVSQTVRELARTSAGVSFEDRGEKTLKGIGESVRVWAVIRG